MTGIWKETGNTEFRRRDSHGSEASRTLVSSRWETSRVSLPSHAGVSRRQYYCRTQAAIPGGLRQRRCERRSSIFSSSEQTCSTSAGTGLKRRVVTRRRRTEERLGWTGRGRPLAVGSSYTVREICDGQSLASPMRWAVDDRRYPEDSVWSEVAKRYMTYSKKVGTPELLTSLALGKISSCPFPPEETDALKQGVIGLLRTKGLFFGRPHEDRCDVPIDVRYLSLLLQASQDPESSLGEFSRGVRVGPGVRLPRPPALFQKKKKWRLPDQGDPFNLLGRRDRWGSHAETELLVDCGACILGQ